jgi:hypothetical protein
VFLGCPIILKLVPAESAHLTKPILILQGNVRVVLLAASIAIVSSQKRLPLV